MKTTYISACGLLLCAILFDLSAKRGFAYVADRKARCLTAEQEMQENVKEECETALKYVHQQTISSIVSGILGFGFWIISVVRQKAMGKRLTPVLPLVLLIAYALIFAVDV